MILFLEIHFAFGAHLAFFGAGSGHQVPAGDGEVENRGAFFVVLLAAIAYLPTWGYRKELLDAGDVEAIICQEATQALEPLQVVIGIETLATTSAGFDQAFLFVDAQRARMNIQ
jgi:hypothetical protein